MASYDVVIIGSGLVGASTANALMRAGAGRVLLLDRGNAGGGDSALTFGMVRRHYTNPVLIQLSMAGTDILARWDEEVGVGTAPTCPRDISYRFPSASLTPVAATLSGSNRSASRRAFSRPTRFMRLSPCSPLMA